MKRYITMIMKELKKGGVSGVTGMSLNVGGESPLLALVRRTIREGKGVHREVESEESRIQMVSSSADGFLVFPL